MGYPITSGWISFTGSSFYYWHGFASFRSWRSIIWRSKLMGNGLYIKKGDAYARSKRMENVCFSSPQMEKFLLNTAMVYI